jgi:hypothetical protein
VYTLRYGATAPSPCRVISHVKSFLWRSPKATSPDRRSPCYKIAVSVQHCVTGNFGAGRDSRPSSTAQCAPTPRARGLTASGGLSASGHPARSCPVPPGPAYCDHREKRLRIQFTRPSAWRTIRCPGPAAAAHRHAGARTRGAASCGGGAGCRRDSGRGARAPLALGTARGGAGRQGGG